MEVVLHKKGQKQSSKRPRVSFAGLGRAIRYLGHYKSLAIQAYIYLFISTVAMLLVPQLVQNIIDGITNGFLAQMVSKLNLTQTQLAGVLQRLNWTQAQLNNNLTGAESAIVSAGVLIVVFAIARGLFAYAQSYTSERVSQSIAFDFRNDLYAKIQRLSFSYHDQNQTGQLMIRATDDVEKVRIFIGQGLLMTVQSFIMLAGSLILLLFTNVQLVLVILPILPIMLVIFIIFGGVSQPLFVQVQVKLSRLNTVLQENLAGIKVVKAFVREPEQQKRFNLSAQDLMNQQIKVARLFSFLFPVVFMVANLGQAIVMYFGGQQIIQGTLTLGEWQKFTMYLMYLLFPLGQLGFIISQLGQAGASANRIYEILDVKNEVSNKPDAICLPELTGNDSPAGSNRIREKFSDKPDSPFL
jgi:ATP-binding cassette subfamily B multidrug efflux pump